MGVAHLGPGDVVASRFAIDAVAGAGAFGQVFRARDAATGRWVALKVVDVGRREIAERFERETTLLATVRHPNVVAHVASGVEGDRFAYLAMEWLEGEDLARRLGRGVLAAAELVALARGALAGLAAAHALGIVHRDVKPSNVWLVDGSTSSPKVLDFGLARLAAQTSLTRVGTFLGTPEYMAPEQVKGAASLDQRADLFSLGCVLFECASGRTPFAAPTALAVATRILLDEPPRIDTDRPDVPPALADAVAALLAKSPEQRPDLATVTSLLDAAAVAVERHAAAIERHTGAGAKVPTAAPAATTTAATERPPPLARASLASEPPIARRRARAAAPGNPESSAASSAESSLLGRAPPFAGRDAELEALGHAFDACVREKSARAVLVEGPAGCGKSRLKREFLAVLARRSTPLVIEIRGEASRRGEPLGALARATSEALGLPPASAGADALRADLQLALAPRLPASHVARVGAFFGELLGAPFADEAHPLLGAARAEGARTGDQIARAWVDWIDAECQQHPVVVTLDDAPLVDRPTLDVVAGALRHLQRRRLLVLTLARTGPRDAMPDALEGRRALRVPLGPLPAAASATIARAALGEGVAPVVITTIVERSAGLPLHLEELVRAAAAGTDLGPTATLEAMVGERLQALDAEAREVLQAASVLGSVFDEAGVASMLDGRVTPIAVSAASSRLVVAELASDVAARPVEVDGRQLAFRHVMVRDAAYAGIAAPLRALLHARAARWLARTGPWSPAVVAEHLVRAGEAEAARAFFRRAASVAMESNDFAGADAAVERALDVGAADEELGQLRLLQADARRHMADNEVMLARALEACAALPPWSRPWFRAASLVVLGAIRLGRPELLDRMTPALDEAAARGDLPAAAARTAHYLFFAGRSELADRLLSATGDATDAEPDRDAWVARACATRALLAGDMGAYLEHLEHAIAAFELAGDLREQAAERVNAGFARMEMGLWDDAEATLRSGLEVAARTGLRHVEAVARVNLGETLFRAGRADEALVALDAAIGALRRQRNLRMEGNACIYRARLHLAAGEAVAALRDATCAVERLAHVAPLLPVALAALAAVHLGAGRVGEADAAATDALARLNATGRVDEGEGFVRRTAAEVAMAAGRRQDAIHIIVEARERMLSRAGRIGRDDWRATFLAMADHVRTLELWRWWTGGTIR